MVFNTLNCIARKLNSKGILWGVGASILLNYYELVEKPNDIDILVHVKDIEKTDKILSCLGEKKSRKRVDTYSTKHFYEYVINDIDIDVMAGLIVNHNCGKYKYEFDYKSITTVKNVNGVDIPLTSLEDWYVIYQLIPGRENKVKMIEDYLKENGIENRYLLNRALNKELPQIVRDKIKKILS